MLIRRIQFQKERPDIEERKENNLRASFPGMGCKIAVEVDALILD